MIFTFPTFTFTFPKLTMEMGGVFTNLFAWKPERVKGFRGFRAFGLAGVTFSTFSITRLGMVKMSQIARPGVFRMIRARGLGRRCLGSTRAISRAFSRLYGERTAA